MKDLDAIYFAAREHAPAARPAYLTGACGNDNALRSRVEQMLAVADQADAFLTDVPDAGTEERKPEGPPATTRKVDPADLPDAIIGQRIGRYKILERVGEGGCGVVYVAEQTEPVRRRVALKVIKLGMDTKAVVARFEAERQALAMMDHPNIAKVLDAGATDKGRPYFVMELVRGIRITDYCDQNNLATRDRLDLFIKVCQAIQHAHQKGIIHRDIKPSNILVTLHDGVPVPKVIDFGIAKATEGRLSNLTVYTEIHQFIGTPAYMSPEQAEMSGLDIDTRSDIYALGVLLYELLTGQTPFDAQKLVQSGLDEIRRTIREVEPPKPSTRLSTMLNADLTLVAKRHGLEPSKLSKLVRGDLDWIVMTCLEKDRSRRYETANGLATDIQRHLNNEPIHACPPSTLYRLGKWTRRNKLAFAAGTAIAASLLIGIAASVWQAVRATQAEANARQRLTQIQKGNEIITSIFADLDIRRVKEGSDPLEAVLAHRLVKAAGQLEGESVGDPLVVAGLQNRLGKSLLNLGHPREAIPLFEKSRETFAAKLGASHHATLACMGILALAYQDADKLDLALPLYEESLKLQQATLSPHHPEILASMNNLAWAYQAAGKLDLALPLYENTLKLTQARNGADHHSTLLCMNNLALGYKASWKLNLAQPLLEKTLGLMKAKVGADHVDTLLCMNNLASVYELQGKLDLALPLYEESLKLMKAKLGADYPDTLKAMNNLAGAYRKAGKSGLALQLCEETVRIQKAKVGPDHINTLIGMDRLALAYQDTGQRNLALPLAEETLKLKKAKLGADHPETLKSMNNLANLYRIGQPDLALPLLEETLKLKKLRLGADHVETLATMNDLAVFHKAGGRLDLALPLLEETLALYKARLGYDHPDTLTIQNNLGEAYRAAGKLDRALPLMEETLKLSKAKLGPEHPHTLKTMNNLANSYCDAGKPDLALPLLEEALKLQKTKLGADHPDLLATMNNLAMAYKDAGKLDLAFPLLEATLKLSKARMGADDPETIISVNNSALIYFDAGKPDLALPLLQEAARGVEKLRFQHQNAGRIVANLIACHERLKQFDQAEIWRRKWLAVLKERNGADSRPYATELMALGYSLLQQNKWIDAEPVLRECLSILEEKQPGRSITFNTQSFLGASLSGQAKYTEAEPLLLKAYEGITERARVNPDPARNTNIQQTAERIIQLYEAWGKPTQAAEWRQKQGTP